MRKGGQGELGLKSCSSFSEEQEGKWAGNSLREWMSPFINN